MSDASDQLEAIHRRFEELGPKLVREQRKDWPPDLSIRALEWLAQKDREETHFEASSKAEQMELARASRDLASTSVALAERSVRAAERSNKIAMIAVVVAIITIVVSIIGMVHNGGHADAPKTKVQAPPLRPGGVPAIPGHGARSRGVG